VVPLVSPPLRSHAEDIPLLVENFVTAYCAENALPVKTIDPEAMGLLERYTWPGNVRELRNQVERMLIMSAGTTIGTDDVGAELKGERTAGAGPTPGAKDVGAMTISDAKKEFERSLILKALDRNDWNVTKAADELGLERTNLHKKIKQYNLVRSE
jgi:DNA-binding NtrC family response regulator